MYTYTVTEPHPTIRTNSYVRSGRGGAGNYFRAPAPTPITSKSTTTTTTTTKPPAPSRFHFGRGGAGNVHVSATNPMLSFDEVFARLTRIANLRIGHVGRGGAGNVCPSPRPNATVDLCKGSDASSEYTVSSFGSFGSLSKIWSRLRDRP
ncbi:hypothetical protein GGR54DRAFT_508497 [Hypoxylon sp. NC1633]|nr:hypothetical protein GGR54DRAFT_508497 [Hypoxylon sp. NC1633]